MHILREVGGIVLEPLRSPVKGFATDERDIMLGVVDREDDGDDDDDDEDDDDVVDVDEDEDEAPDKDLQTSEDAVAEAKDEEAVLGGRGTTTAAGKDLIFQSSTEMFWRRYRLWASFRVCREMPLTICDRAKNDSRNRERPTGRRASCWTNSFKRLTMTCW